MQLVLWMIKWVLLIAADWKFGWSRKMLVAYGQVCMDLPIIALNSFVKSLLLWILLFLLIDSNLFYFYCQTNARISDPQVELH